MTDGGWSRDESPFHAGEREIQARLGVREKIERQGRRMVRDYLPDQQREFYVDLPFLLAGSIDDRGRLWASILAGAPGFLSSPDDRTLRVAARPFPGDPLNEALAPGAEVGLLGIDLQTRRRNRLNGAVVATSDAGFEVRARQTFGNCPKYIQRRALAPVRGPTEAGASPPGPPRRVDALGDAERTMIERSDTFFIATAFAGTPGDSTHGVDVSHRGGKPGFVRIDDARTLTFPDFTGNFCFNTLGNLLLDRRAGLLFVDFVRGDLLYMTGEAEIVWEGAEVTAFAGAERLLRFRLADAIRVEGVLPLRWAFEEYSPSLVGMGSWEQAARTLGGAGASRDE